MHRIQTSDHRFAADTVVTPEWLNSVQEEVANVVEYAGLRLSTSKNDLMTQLWEAIELIKGKPEYDYVVATQDDFNYLVERTGANAYKIKDAYKSVLFKYKASGYLCYGTSSFLQTSDTWGALSTNLCTHLVFEGGAYFNSGTNPFYVEVNTDDCRLDNVYIKGSTAGAGAITKGFQLNAYRVTYNNCMVSDRLTNESVTCFQGSATDAHNITSKYNNCTVHTISNATAAKTTVVFFLCYNLSNCVAYAINNSGASNLFCFYLCNILSNCIAYDLDGTTSEVRGFSGCSIMSSCYAYTLDSTSGDGRGFNVCTIMSSCYANNIDTTSGVAKGFNACSILSACQANDIDTTTSTAYGITGSSYISAFYTSEANNASNDWADTDDAAITNKYSCPAVWT